jgi:hypothetical protein
LALVSEPGVPVSTRQQNIHGKWHLREGDQLDVALPVLAQDTDVVVQPQPSVLDVEGEGSTDDLEVELEGDAFGKASSSTGNLELGKEREFSVSTDAERLSIEVDDDDDLPKLTVSSAAQKLSEGIISYPDGNGTKTERHFEGLLVVCGVDITVLDGEDVDLASVSRLANAMMVTEPASAKPPIFFTLSGG